MNSSLEVENKDFPTAFNSLARQVADYFDNFLYQELTAMKRHDVDYRIVESLGAFMKNLNDVSRNGALVVVEGKRDAEALKALGFEGPLLTISHRAKFATLAQEAEKFEKTILLLDFDAKGRVLTKRAALLLQEKKNVIDLYFRKQLAFITRGKLKHVEDLIRYKDYVKDYVKGFATY